MSNLSVALDMNQPKLRGSQCLTGAETHVFTEIYQEDINIVVWQRKTPSALEEAAKYILEEHPDLTVALTTSPVNAKAVFHQKLGTSEHANILSDDIALLADMFSCIFDLERIGIRLTSLKHAMCPRFHVDKVHCRLVTTYQGDGTQWLANDAVDRTKLGPGNAGEPDKKSGLIKRLDNLHQIDQGDVALLKGESWENNTGFGLVHRSPKMQKNNSRLLLTLDFA